MRNKLVASFLAKNTQLNLSAIRDPDWVHIKHIQDSLKLLETWLFQPWKLVIDVGTWWGFPLMPLALSCPEVRFLGLDSVRKKTIAVNEMLAELNIHNAQVLRTRIEEYQGEKADLITARAVAYVDKLIDRSYPLLKSWGHFLFMKQKLPEEKQILLQICKDRHLSLVSELDYQLFEGDIQRVIYMVRKN